MKFIYAIIRIAKMNETKAALADVGLYSFTAMSVVGRGNGRGLGEKYAQLKADPFNKEILAQLSQMEPRLKSKRAISLVVTDEKKDLAIATIIKTNQTGNSGDGKIFVTQAIESLRVRTSETGDSTLD